METITVKAKAIKETFANGDYRIFSWMPLQTYENIQLSPYMCFSTKGETPYITEGKDYELELELIKHDAKWGDSFRIIDVPSMRLENLSKLTREQQFEMLMDITSSERLANNILDAYPNFFEIILTKGKQEIDLKKIYGVGEKYLSAYEREINTKYKYLNLINKLKNYKVDVSDCKTLYNLYDNEYEIEKKIKENPYRVLTEVLDHSFNKSDKLILDLRPELHDSEIRCEAIMNDVLKRNEIGDREYFDGGSTRLNGNILWAIMVEEYDAPSEWSKTIKELARNSDQIYYDEESKDLARINTYLGECLIADFVKEKISNPIIWDFDCEQFKEIKEGTLTEEQLNVPKMVCKNNLVILNASAGCGKTSSMLAFIQMLEHYNKTYKCVTATGKAAKRLSESINGRPASTIHRACLGGKTINTDVLIVDEHSFLSVDLMVMLINAIDNPNMKILLIGDVEQIPNLSLGKPIRDMIESGLVPVCSLTKCFRFGIGGISTVSTLARQGQMYIDENEFDGNPVFVGKNKDYEFIPFNNTMEQITDCYENLMNKYNLKPKDICVISPYNINTFGAININNAIQEIVNPPKPNENTIINEFVKNNRTYKTTFREGDIVMNTVNNYSMIPLESWEEIQKDTTLTTEDLSKVECMNGEIGKILEIKDNIMKIQFDENIIIFNKMDAKNLLLAYASNPYKMQGSQCKWIINLTISEHQKSLNRQLLYTSLTRAKDGLIEIGELNIIKQAINTLGDIHRNTWLKELLEKED